jgi:hypothetical protein
MLRISLATPGTEACDAVGGALRLQWREWHQSREAMNWRLATKPTGAALFDEYANLIGFGPQFMYLTGNGYRFDAATITMVK